LQLRRGFGILTTDEPYTGSFYLENYVAETPDKNSKANSQSKPKRQLKKQATVRQRAEKATTNKKPRRFKLVGATIARPLKKVAKTGKKEYYLPLPDNKVGRFLNKKRKFIPSYFRESWQELKLVTWPNRKETIKLTFAVFIFATFFAIFVTVIDFGLDKIFKQLILN
jgi:preprotein translocase subunit SecE